MEGEPMAEMAEWTEEQLEEQGEDVAEFLGVAVECVEPQWYGPAEPSMYVRVPEGGSVTQVPLDNLEKVGWQFTCFKNDAERGQYILLVPVKGNRFRGGK